MKKLTALILAAMFAACLSACDTTGTESDISESPETSVDAQADESSDTADESAEDESSSEASENESTEDGGSSSEASAEAQDSEAESPSESSSDTEDSQTSKSSSSTGSSSLLQSGYYDIVDSGSYYMDLSFSGAYSDEAYTCDAILAKDGEKIYIYMWYDFDSYSYGLNTIYDGENYYVIDDETKTGFCYNDYVETSEEDYTELFHIGYSEDMILLNSGTTTYGGSSCRFETYGEESSGETFTYYFKNGKLIAIEMSSDDEQASVIVNELTAEVSSDIFVVPDDYEIVDYKDYYSLVYSDLE